MTDIAKFIRCLMESDDTADSSPPKFPAPAINDAFWFEQSKELVLGATTTRDTASDKLQEGIKWVWSAYTAAALVGAAVVGKDYPWWAILLMTLPVLVLPAAFFAAGEIRIPIKVKFNPASPPEIRDAHYRTADHKETWMRHAKRLTYFGALLVVIAIFTAAFAADDDEAANTFNAALDGSGAATVLLVSGEWKAGTKVTFTVSSKSGDTITAPSTRDYPRMTPPDGELSATFPVGEAKSYSVRAAWIEEKVGARSLELSLKPEEASS